MTILVAIAEHDLSIGLKTREYDWVGIIISFCMRNGQLDDFPRVTGIRKGSLGIFHSNVGILAYERQPSIA